jgi:transmembrane sensor
MDTHDSPPTLPPEWLDQYLAGTLGDDEHRAVERWLAADPLRRQRIGAIRSSLGRHTPAVPYAAVREQFGARIRDLAEVPVTPERQKLRKFTPRVRGIPGAHPLITRLRQGLTRGTVAVSVVSAAICVSALFVTQRNIQSTGQDNAQLRERTYTTLPGQRARVAFASGTEMLLAPATTLIVRANPAGQDIDVHVSGEAMFHVVPGARRSFRVHAGQAVAAVLGTRFVVRHYQGDAVSRVVVADGRVALRSRSDMHVLDGHTMGIVDDSGQVRVVPKADITEYTAWTTGTLVFRDTPARDAIAELSRAYGVDIRLADSAVGAQPISWTVTITQRSLNDVLDLLGDGLGVHAIRRGQIITLVRGRSTSRKPVESRSLHVPENHYGR